MQTISIFPMFLIGALAVQIRSELAFGPAALGAVTAGFVLSRAVTSITVGGWVDRLGAVRSLRLSALGAMLTALAISMLARSWATLFVCMLVFGVVQAAAQPAANRMLARAVPPHRLGIAFGAKQSGPPLAISFAGLAVPAIALSVGWRWAFVVAAGMALAAFFWLPNLATARSSAQQQAPEHPAATEGVGLLALATGLAFLLGTVNSLNTFLVDAAVEAGFAPGRAGWLLTLGGLVAVTARLTLGFRADRRAAGHLRLVAAMLALGAPGLLLIGTGRMWFMVLGAVMAYATVWGANGVFFFAVVKANPSRPAAASGRVIAGGSIGGFAAPAIFGLIAENVGYAGAWAVSAGWATLAALAIARAHVLLARAA